MQKKPKVASREEVRLFLEECGYFEREEAIAKLIEEYASSIANHARITHGKQNLAFVTQKLLAFVADVDEIRAQVDF